MNRTKKTIANAVSQIFSVFCQSVFALFVTRSIIKNIGSDINGITSTATQILAFLALIEGGFTLASQVKMYKPYNDSNYCLLNKYVSLSNKKYKKIGILYFVVGVLVSIAYTPFIKSEAPFATTAIIIILAIISSAFNVFYVCKFRLIFQVSQSEYFIYIIQTIVYCAMYATEICVLEVTKNILYARICVCLFQILAGLVIGITAKKLFPQVKYNVECDNVQIIGTKEVFVGKICGLVFSSAPVLYISTFVGTIYTSIYAVYNNVFNIMSNMINAFLLAPRNALGQLVNSDDKDRLINVFNEYDFVSAFALSILYSVTFILIIPFVRLYTSDIADIDYIDVYIALLLVLNAVAQMIHIPSGTLIEVSGRFRVAKIIQSIGAITISIASLIGALSLGVYGILLAKFFTSVVLAVLEIGYVRTKIVKTSVFAWARLIAPSLITGTGISIAEFLLLFDKKISVLQFVGCGLLFVTINCMLIIAINLLFNRDVLKNSTIRLLEVLKKKKA